MHATTSMPHPARGIACMVTSVICFAIMSNIVRHASAEMNSFQMVFMRNLLGVGVMLPWLALHYREAKRSLRASYIKHITRSVTGIMGMQLWYYGLTRLPVPEATAISFMTPIFVTLGAIVFFGEKVGPVRWAAIGAGFLGMLIVTRPGTESFTPAALVVLSASFMWAVSGLLVKRLSQTETPGAMVFYMNVLMMLFSLPPAMPVWQEATAEQWGWMLGAAVSSSFAQYYLARAYALADAVTIMPFDFTRLIFTSIIAYFAFGEVLDLWGWAGAGVIAGSAVLIAHREARKKRLGKGA